MPEHRQSSLAIAERRSAVLRAGLTWLYETEQPAEAIDQHHGAYSPAVDGRICRFIPVGWQQHPVVVVDVAHPVYDGHEVTNPLGGPAEVAEVVDALAELGRRHLETWNGVEGSITASISLVDAAHPSLVAAVHRYFASCPEHGSVFCGTQHDCTWFRDGKRLIVPPSWPASSSTPETNP